MSKTLRLSGVVKESIVDGAGLRLVVFSQGCPHHCPECHNPHTHDFDKGTDTDIQKIVDEVLKNPMLRGVTFSGGEPFCQADGFAELAKRLKSENRKLDIMVYSGWTYEQLIEKAKKEPAVEKLLSLCDTMVDGPFVVAQKDLTLRYRGSKNQRYIDLNRTRISGKVTLVSEFGWVDRRTKYRGC